MTTGRHGNYITYGEWRPAEHRSVEVTCLLTDIECDHCKEHPPYPYPCRCSITGSHRPVRREKEAAQ